MIAAPQVEQPQVVKCACGHVIYDGQVIRSRCVKLHEQSALCRCKRWVKVPVKYAS